MSLQQILNNNPQLNQQLQKAVSEIKANQRLRLGFWLVVGITLFYIGMIMDESRGLAEKELTLAKQRESKAIHLVQENFWTDRATESQQALYQLQSQFDRASTQGVAKATLQGLMNDLVKQSALTKTRVRVNETDNIVGDLSLWGFMVSIDGELNPEKLQQFLYNLTHYQYHLVVENLEILPNLSRFRMRVKYWFANKAELASIEEKLALLSNQLANQSPNRLSKESPLKQSANALSKNDIEQLKNSGFPSEIFQ